MQLTLRLAALIVLLDQITKWVIVALVMDPPREIVVTGFFSLVLTHNTGVSFGLFSGGPEWRAWALSLLAVAVAAGLLIWARRQRRPAVLCAIGLIVGGALGNVLDRLLGSILGLLDRPGVVDFLLFHAGGWSWPAFNLADSSISVGVALLLFDGLFLDRESGRLPG